MKIESRKQKAESRRPKAEAKADKGYRLLVLKECLRNKLQRSDLSIAAAEPLIRSSIGATSQSSGRSYGATVNINNAETIDRSSLRGLLKHSLKRFFRLLTAYCLLPSAFCFLISDYCARAQTVDQILTIVNQEIITRSDLLWSIALDPKSPSPAGNLGSDVLRQKLDVMIDQRLIEQEARRVPGARITAEEITKRRTELIAQFQSEAAFRQRVEAVGLTPQKIDELVREMIYIERFVDFRFRSFVFVTEQDIKSYYDERLVPEIRKRGQVPPALDATLDRGVTVRESINSILKQEKINQEIDTWLNATRQRADIVHLAEP